MNDSAKRGIPDASPGEEILAPDIEVSSEDYARRFAGNTGAWMLKVQEEATARLLAPWPGATVLDVGGGHGQLAGPLEERGYRVTVLGSDPSCAQRIQPLLDARRCSFEVGNLLRLPYPDRSFDAVISFRTISHIPPWDRLVAELCRVAREVVVLDFAASRSLNVLSPLLFHLKRRIEGNTRPFAVFRERELVAAFERQGFKPAGRRAQFFWPMVAHRALRAKPLSAAIEAPVRWIGLTALVGSPVVASFARRR